MKHAKICIKVPQYNIKKITIKKIYIFKKKQIKQELKIIISFNFIRKKKHLKK